MRLCEHRDFDQVVLRAAAHFKDRGLRAAIVEKDYYVTEALRELARVAGDHLLFKGGTSLSKGWGLIDRFSEDIDLFLDPDSFEPALGAKRVDKKLAELRDVVTLVPGLRHTPTESQSFKGKGRSDSFEYVTRVAATGDVRTRVLLEAGTGSGREPTEVRTLTSYLGQFLAETNVSLGAADEGGFAMKLLHFRRTFVEKLFALHGKVEKVKRAGVPLGAYARHYYDLYLLAAQPEVLQMLGSAEFRAIQDDYEVISLTHFPRDYACPEGRDFRKSDALFPPAGLRERLGSDYFVECQRLCYRPPPSWDDVLGRFGTLRDLLRPA